VELHEATVVTLSSVRSDHRGASDGQQAADLLGDSLDEI
jgi:hypothetical protein